AKLMPLESHFTHGFSGRGQEIGIVIPADGKVEYLMSKDDGGKKTGCKGIWFKPFDFSRTKQPFTPPRP
ncbi:MAG: hypothetical protein WCP45_18870, partial [Verrucomicrobiota bacterium]